MEQKQSKMIDIEKIMDEIKENARTSTFDEIPELSEVKTYLEAESEYDKGTMHDIVRQLLMRYVLTTETPFPAGGPKGFAKKAVRKANRFWAIPITSRQTQYNTLVARGFNQVNNYINEQQDVIEQLEKRIAQLEKKLNGVNGSKAADED